jgi:hypothetical protein
MATPKQPRTPRKGSIPAYEYKIVSCRLGKVDHGPVKEREKLAMANQVRYLSLSTRHSVKLEQTSATSPLSKKIPTIDLPNKLSEGSI